jgi:hypothetical protein
LTENFKNLKTNFIEKVLGYYKDFLPVLSSNLEKRPVRTFDLISKYYGITLHANNNMINIDRKNPNILKGFTFPKTIDNSSKVAIMKAEYLSKLTIDVCECSFILY